MTPTALRWPAPPARRTGSDTVNVVGTGSPADSSTCRSPLPTAARNASPTVPPASWASRCTSSKPTDAPATSRRGPSGPSSVRERIGGRMNCRTRNPRTARRDGGRAGDDRLGGRRVVPRQSRGARGIRRFRRHPPVPQGRGRTAARSAPRRARRRRAGGGTARRCRICPAAPPARAPGPRAAGRAGAAASRVARTPPRTHARRAPAAPRERARRGRARRIPTTSRRRVASDDASAPAGVPRGLRGSHGGARHPDGPMRRRTHRARAGRRGR